MTTRCLCLGKGQVDILFDGQLASQPAAIGQPTSNVTKYQHVRLQIGQIVGGRRTGSLTTLGPSPWSQHFHLFPFRSDLPDQGQASDKNELCSPLYTLALCSGTVCSFVSTSTNHIFLHAMLRNVIQTMFSLDQFTHILPPSI